MRCTSQPRFLTTPPLLTLICLQLIVLPAFAQISAPSWMAGCQPTRNQDWIARTTPLAARISPSECSILTHTPPMFAWPKGDAASYQLILRDPTGKTQVFNSQNNWMLPGTALPSGAYQWTVRALDGNAKTLSESAPRRFRIANNAQALVVPPIEELYQRAAASQHPRTFAPGQEGERLKALMLTGARRDAFTRLLNRVRQAAQTQPEREPMFDPASAIGWDSWAKAQNAAKQVGNRESNKILEASLAWRVTQGDEFVNSTKLRLMSLASWSPSGMSGYRAEPGTARHVLMALVVGYDWLYPILTETERVRVRWTITTRLAEVVEQIVLGRAYDSYDIAAWPYNSQGIEILGIAASAALVVAGEEQRAAELYAAVVPRLIQLSMPWGGDDGGFANGTSYALWDVGDFMLPHWDALRWTTGVDLRRKSWATGFSNYLAYFLPPGTMHGVFGDGAEINRREEWARFGKAYANRMSSPLMRWYATQLSGEEGSDFHALLTPPPSTASSALPTNAASAWIFPSIGWVAMHSALADRNRFSVYFKSSAFGSYNHSHADQNSFIVNARGRALLIDSGYYDWYGSPHWREWTKQTRAHNAITFDNGRGQGLGGNGTGDMSARGTITQFSHGDQADIVTGDATAAYKGELTRAVRSLVYFRPGVVLVFDALASVQARTWEWNLHSLQQMESDGNKLSVGDDDASLCVDFYASGNTTFSQTDQFTAAPGIDPAPNQWHGRFATAAKHQAMQFAAVIRMDCAPIEATVQISTGLIEIVTEDTKVRFDGTRVSLLPIQ